MVKLVNVPIVLKYCSASSVLVSVLPYQCSLANKLPLLQVISVSIVNACPRPWLIRTVPPKMLFGILYCIETKNYHKDKLNRY